MKKYKLKKGLINLIIKIIVCINILLIALIMLNKSFTLESTKDLYYQQKSNIDYKVELKENSYYNNEQLEKNMQYISNLIDKIKINIKYNIKCDKVINYKLNYYIDSEIRIYSTEDDATIYNKIEKIKEEELELNNTKTASINDSIEINYDYYNDQIKKFKSTYGVTKDSELLIKFYVEILDENNKVIKSSKNKPAAKVTIPLTEQYVKIKTDTINNDNHNTVNETQKIKIGNKLLFTGSILSFIILILLIIKTIKSLKMIIPKKTEYEKFIKKTIKDYGDLIVEVNENIEIPDDYHEIVVKTFNELLDAAVRLDKPILFYEIELSKKSIFIIKNDNEIYKFEIENIEEINKE